jgi:glycosyltransferase involved in cell wall biosynthesis
MKIAVSARRFGPPFVGGADVFAERLCRALDRAGHEVTVLAFNSAEETTNGSISVGADQYNDANIWQIKFSIDHRPQETFHYAYDREMGEVVKRILRKEKPDLFIIMNFYLATLALVEVAKELGIPVVHIATDFIPICRRATFIRWDGSPCQVGESIKSCSACFVSSHPVGRLAASIFNQLPEETLIRFARKNQSDKIPKPMRLLKPYWKQVGIMDKRLRVLQPLREMIDIVLTPTDYTQKAFLANGFSPDQVHLLPFGVEMDGPLAKVEHLSAANTRFLFIGRLQPYKGIHLLVEAFNNLQSPKGSTLTIYGAFDGYEKYFKEVEKKISTNDRIRFGGRIEPQDLPRAFAEADYFVLPSTWHENSPLILLDALQSRTPLIASDIGGVSDMVKNGKNGFLFPMGDKLALQQVLQKVIDHPGLVQQLRAGVELISIDDYASTLLNLCNQRA